LIYMSTNTVLREIRDALVASIAATFHRAVDTKLDGRVA